MVKDDTQQLQEQTLQLLRDQQQAFLDALKDWQEAAGDSDAWPRPPELESMPTPAEMAEMSATFTAKLLADQSQFLEEIGKLLARRKGSRR